MQFDTILFCDLTKRKKSVNIKKIYADNRLLL